MRPKKHNSASLFAIVYDVVEPQRSAARDEADRAAITAIQEPHLLSPAISGWQPDHKLWVA